MPHTQTQKLVVEGTWTSANIAVPTGTKLSLSLCRDRNLYVMLEFVLFLLHTFTRHAPITSS